MQSHAFTNIKFIFTERTSVHNGLRSEFLNKFSPIEITIDEMDDEEIDMFIDIVDNIGFWGDKAKSGITTKRKIIKSDNGGQLSLNLLAFFNSEHIKSRVTGIINNIQNEEDKRTVFSICLLEVMGIAITASLVSEVASSNAIFTRNFKNHNDLSQLFIMSGNEIKSKSSVFSLFLIRNNFSSTYIINELLRVVTKYDSFKNDNYVVKAIFRHLLRFHFVERIFPDASTNSSLIKYYEELKSHLTWLKNDVHYWLQYGMCQMTSKNYPLAQRYLDTAYSLATKKQNYDTDYIDSQQARLYLLKAEENHLSNDAFKLFQQAHNLLKDLPNDGYKFKRIMEYHKIYTKHYKGFTSNNKSTFITICKSLLHILNDILLNTNSLNSNTNKVYHLSYEKLNYIVNNS